MTVKKLIGMVVVLVLLVVIAVLQRKEDSARHPMSSASSATLLDGVDLNAITQIEIAQSSNRVDLAKTSGRWTVASLYNYPADFGRLAAALRKMAEVKTGSPVRSGNVAASEFGFDDSARTVVLKTAGASPVASITVGARRSGSTSGGWANQFFVRKNGSDAVYLVDYNFQPFSENPADWISQELLQVPSADVVSVKAGDVALELDGAAWSLTDLNQKTEELQTVEANRLRSALQYLSCVTVADPARTDADLGFDKPFTYVAQTKDGFAYTVTLGAKTDDGRYVRLAVDYTRPAPPVAPAGDDKTVQETFAKELDEFNNLAATNAAKADELNAKWSKWTYVIGSYAADNLQISRDKLVKAKSAQPKPNPEPEGGVSATS